MIGVFDSGFGGLSVYLPLKEALPDEQFLYLADQEFAPYGEKSQAEIIERLKKVGQFFARENIELVVIACNTATLNGIDFLRQEFPQINLVGMVPAIKPAAASSDKIIVLGTRSTVENLVYKNLVETFAKGKRVWNIGAPELVRQVEAGDLKTLKILKEKIDKLVKSGAESIVIGCSHFSFLKPLIKQYYPNLNIFDGADGVVRQALRMHTIASKAPNASIAPNAPIPPIAPIFLTTGIPKKVDFIDKDIKFTKIELPK